VKNAPQALTPKQIEQALATGDPETLRLARAYLDAVDHPYNSWQPRPDQPALFDCQTSFVNDREHNVVVCLGGTGSGKSDAAAKRVAKFLLEEQPPPRKNTPFWILSNTFELACGVQWGEKLAKFIPKEAIAGISWLDAGRETGLPQSLLLLVALGRQSASSAKAKRTRKAKTAAKA
jgi:hypothetical protein